MAAFMEALRFSWCHGGKAEGLAETLDIWIIHGGIAAFPTAWRHGGKAEGLAQTQERRQSHSGMAAFMAEGRHGGTAAWRQGGGISTNPREANNSWRHGGTAARRQGGKAEELA